MPWWPRPTIGRVGAGALIALILSVAGTEGAWAAELFASPAGDGAAPCRASDPCSLDGALAAAGPGDEVTALSGTYDTSGVTVEPGVVLSGPGGGAPAVVSGDGTAPALAAAGAGARVRDLTVHQSDLPPAVEIGTAAVADRLDVTATGAGAACSVPLGGTVRNSLCHARFGNGVLVDEFDPISGQSRLVNVTAISEGEGGVGAALLLRAWSGTAVSVDAANTIAAARGNAPDIAVGALAGGTADLAIRHSNFATVALLGSGASATAPGVAGNQTAEPVFTDADAGDYTEAPGSPTVDAGTAAVEGLGPLDLAGNARVIGPAPDIGAYELQRVTVPGVRIDGPKGRLRTRRSHLKVRFRLSTDVPVAGFRCSLDGAPATSCESPVGYRLRAKRHGGERHVLRVRALDALGNRGAPALRRFRIVRVGR